jgi:hypothetical protein
MDRDWLEAQLAAGRSIESIAKEVGKHPSTVSYWLKKHGLTSHYAELHGPHRHRHLPRASAHASSSANAESTGARLGFAAGAAIATGASSAAVRLSPLGAGGSSAC